MASKRSHPRGLYALFFTEMWERFSFYCMLSVLTLYMNAPVVDGGLGFSSDRSTQIYGLYIAFVYFTPLFGGILADRVLGYGRTIIIGGVAMMLGHILLAFEAIEMFYGGLIALIIGNGLFKPNISTMVGNLYRDNPELKDSGFNIFYMGINIGAFISPLIATWMKNSYGWHFAFGAAGIGMLISLIVFLGTRRFTSAGERAPETAVKVQTSPAERKSEGLRVQALFILYAVVILFWMAFHQNGSTLNFWARDNTLPLFGIDFEKRAEITQAINPFFVVVFTLFLVVPFWRWLRKRGKEPSTPTKIMLGMLLTALAFAVMGFAGLSGGDAGRVSALWLVSGYGVVTLGELCLSPMGLSVVSKLAPARHAGVFMGLWFVATAIGNYLSGAIGGFWDDWPHSQFFFFLTGSSLVAAFILWRVLGRLDAAMRSAEHPNDPVGPEPSLKRSGVVG